MSSNAFVRAALVVLSSTAWLGLAVLGDGGSVAPFFAHPPLIALVVALCLMIGASLFADGNLSPGVREDRGNRWVLIVFTAIGLLDGYLPAWTDRNRFSGLVAIQPGHKLVTSGIYGVIRHPSYLGMLVMLLGWALAFRSAAGVLLTGLMIPPLLARIGAEERMLHLQFGAEYDNYRARTSRLIPGIY